MKLLITTQAVDKNHPILGFFHGWILEFAKHFERIDVICLLEGEHNLPAHVHVHSLGKEEEVSNITYVVNFFMYAWRLRNEYDVVFSHMNPHYIVLAGLYWKLCAKKIFFWRNHAKMNTMTYIAAWFSTKVFYTSPFACTTRFKHSVQMPVGIDTNHFKPDPAVKPKEKSVLFLGRLSRVKRPELFLEAVRPLSEYSIHVYGDEPDGPGAYTAKLKELASENTHFYGAVSNYMTPQIYCANELYVNLTPKGSMDKTILEAASCGTLVLVSNDSMKDSLPESMFLEENNPTLICERITMLHSLSAEDKGRYRRGLREMVQRDHSLQKLGDILSKYMAA